MKKAQNFTIDIRNNKIQSISTENAHCALIAITKLDDIEIFLNIDATLSNTDYYVNLTIDDCNTVQRKNFYCHKQKANMFHLLHTTYSWSIMKDKDVAISGYPKHVIMEYRRDHRFPHEIKVEIVLSEIEEDCEEIIPTRSSKITFDQPISVFTDVVFCINDREVYCNRQLMALISPVFEEMLFGTSSEKPADRIRLFDVYVNDFINMLHTVYPSHRPITNDTVIGILDVATKYKISCVIEKCDDFLSCSMEMDHALPKFLYLAEKFDISWLMKKCFEIVRNHDKVTEVVESEYYPYLSLQTKDQLFKNIFIDGTATSDNEISSKGDGNINNQVGHPSRMQNVLEMHNETFYVSLGSNISCTTIGGVHCAGVLTENNIGKDIFLYVDLSSSEKDYYAQLSINYKENAVFQNFVCRKKTLNMFHVLHFAQSRIPQLRLNMRHVPKMDILIVLELELAEIAGRSDNSPTYNFDQPMKSFSDVVVCINDRKIYCNRQIMALISPVFKGMLFGESSENKDRIQLSDIDADDFINMLHTIYPSHRPITNDTVFGILDVATKYKIEEVFERCDNFLSSTLNHSFPKLLYTAEKFNLPILMRKCLSIARSNSGNAADFVNSEFYSQVSLETKDQMIKHMFVERKRDQMQIDSDRMISNLNYIS